ncbi:hypothetical protein R1flu_018179 [Riccia fluitans]|uniref:Uncharacterized protein n=1 Tax=Riccia fluitans TaxID=41844 RepID=A0ABD1ZGI0_9MARC
MEGDEPEGRVSREAKIQEELDFRRSGSLGARRLSSGNLSCKSLPSEEEDELEGMAGDTGSARRLDVLDSLERRFSSEGPLVLPYSSSFGRGEKFSASGVEKPVERVLTSDEEDELEGMAGDTGSARRLDARDSLERRLSAESQLVVLFSLEGEEKFPVTGLGKPVESAQVVPVPSILTLPTYEFERLSSWLEFSSILAHLTTFGIIGVLIRYGLENLFGSPVAGVTSNNGALFNDLPANMLGSFFMGWVGVVFKKDISMFSEHLAVGLSTGLMGSITTYASMIQRMLTNMVRNRWTNGIAGLFLGMELAQISLIVGVDSAKLLCKILERINHNRGRKGLKPLQALPPENRRRRYWSLIVFTLVGGGLWVGSLLLTVFDSSSISRRTLWLACLVAPPGVWMRWYFARLNGQGIGPKHSVRWLPIGTLLVNVSASSMEAGLATVEAAVGNYDARLLVDGLQLGMLGCLSTVSTFVAEIQIMHQGKNRWRAYVYPISTILISLVIGFLIYGVPVWVLGLNAWYRPLGEAGRS